MAGNFYGGTYFSGGFFGQVSTSTPSAGVSKRGKRHFVEINGKRITVEDASEAMWLIETHKAQIEKSVEAAIQKPTKIKSQRIVVDLTEKKPLLKVKSSLPEVSQFVAMANEEIIQFFETLRAAQDEEDAILVLLL